MFKLLRLSLEAAWAYDARSSLRSTIPPPPQTNSELNPLTQTRKLAATSTGHRRSRIPDQSLNFRGYRFWRRQTHEFLCTSFCAKQCTDISLITKHAYIHIGVCMYVYIRMHTYVSLYSGARWSWDSMCLPFNPPPTPNPHPTAFGQ